MGPLLFLLFIIDLCLGHMELPVVYGHRKGQNSSDPCPRKGQRYILLLDGGIIKGWGSNSQRTAGSSLCAMIKKFYHGIQKAVHQFRFKNVEQHRLLGSGGNQNLRFSCRRPPTRTFHTPVGTLRLDAPALAESAVPMMAINWDEVN